MEMNFALNKVALTEDTIKSPIYLMERSRKGFLGHYLLTSFPLSTVPVSNLHRILFSMNNRNMMLSISAYRTNIMHVSPK